MSEPTGAPAGSSPAPANDTSEISIEDARNMIFAEEPAERAEEATAEPELASTKEADSDPATDPAEAPKDAEPDENPPIERPRSWTKDEDTEWQSLPRAMQQKIVAREQERDSGLRRSQNEAAEDRKAAKAERETAEKVRQQYEAQLPQLMQTLQDAQQSSFADIKTMADVEKLQAEDPFRFQAWQVQQMRLQAASAENERIKTQQAQAQQTEWAQHVQKENALAAEYIPELADKVKGPLLTQRAADRLDELGFKSEELANLASGKDKLSLFDHRVQRLIFSDLKLNDIQSAPKAVAAKPVPQVQRPGVARPSGDADSEHLQALEAKLTKTGNLRDAEALMNAQIAAQSRRRAN